MGKDYYSILSISRTSTQADIKKAYHRKALEFHPDKNRGCDGSFFTEIAEAYDVLSSSNKRNIFDAYGEDGLKDRCNYKFLADPVKIFRDIFFGQDSVYCNNTAKRQRMHIYSDRAQCNRSPPVNKRKEQPIVRDLRVTLEELHTGLTKRIKITKKIESTTHPNKCKVEEKVLEIKIRPGWKDGTRVTFENEGNISESSIPADLVFVIREKKHPNFQRQGDDLVHSTTISLKQSLLGASLSVPTIDSNQCLDARYDKIIHPGYEKVYRNQGMRSQKDYNRRGDLIVRFTIRFPDCLTTEQRDALAHILPD